MDADLLRQRRFARELQRDREEQRRQAHVRVAALLRDLVRAPTVVANALAQVAK
ncbi:protein of unknown function [Burkholderia multivorans]